MVICLKNPKASTWSQKVDGLDAAQTGDVYALFLMDCSLKTHKCVCTHSKRGKGKARLPGVVASHRERHWERQEDSHCPTEFCMDWKFYKACASNRTIKSGRKSVWNGMNACILIWDRFRDLCGYRNGSLALRYFPFKKSLFSKLMSPPKVTLMALMSSMGSN